MHQDQGGVATQRESQQETLRESHQKKMIAGEASLRTVRLMTVGGVYHSANTQIVISEETARRRLLNGTKPSPGSMTMRVTTQEAGDERYSWDRNDFSQIREAKDFFNRMVATGLVPYRVDPKGKKTPVVMDQFDPHAEEIVFAPIAVPHAVVGG